MADVVILGGGAAGLAAALFLLKQGCRPLILEAARMPGGRVRSFFDRRTGEELDNGPHLLLGACQESLALLEQLGTHTHLWQSERMIVPFWTERTGWYRLDCPDWPVPWHLLAGLLRMPGMTFGERWKLLTLGKSLAEGPLPPPGQTVTHWLQEHRQTAHLLHCLWGPLCLAIMNEPPASADAGLLVSTLRRILFGGRGAGRLYIPRVPLSRLLAEPARESIVRQGGEVRCQTPVRGLEMQGDRLAAIVTHAGRLHVQGPVISALPHHVLTRLLPTWNPGWRVSPAYAPIVSIHMRWTIPGGLPVPWVGLPEGVCHWLFDHNLLAGTAEGQPARISAVISGAYREVHGSTGELLAKARQEVMALVPDLDPAREISGRVIREWRATLAPWPDIVAARPGVLTPWRNLFLAGDWTDTGLPATIESAVCSGRRAAQEVLK
ncbi:MAG: FAD-dependent oxidoreductase [Magnetococcales bacterium]|nr:FAD-dependent oxidoreductase [Magnetococcales bacterium]